MSIRALGIRVSAAHPGQTALLVGCHGVLPRVCAHIVVHSWILSKPNVVTNWDVSLDCVWVFAVCACRPPDAQPGVLRDAFQERGVRVAVRVAVEEWVFDESTA